MSSSNRGLDNPNPKYQPDHPRTRSSTTLKAVTAQVIRLKWPEATVLSEARRRTHELDPENSKEVQAMLDALLKEALWTEEEFIEALCQDVKRRGTH